jgi:hypothetical protein
MMAGTNPEGDISAFILRVQFTAIITAGSIILISV